MAVENYHAIQLYRTSATEKRVGINVTDSTDTTGYVLYVNGNTYVKGNINLTGPGSRYKYVSFYQSSGSNVGYIRYDSGNATNVTTGRFRFQQYSGNATATTSASEYYESFSLPTTAQGLTASADYVILTSKTAVTVAQGGTGATTAADARTNLGITPANIGAATSSHNHDITTLTNYAARVYDATVSRTKNTVLAAPNGSAGAASFRALVVADLPTGTTSSTVSLGNHTHDYAAASHEHTRVGVSTIWLYPNNSNEINFGGTNTSDTIYFGYRATDSRPKPATYIFGSSSSGTATVKAATFVGSLTGNASSATSATSATALTSNAGSARQPVYFTGGKPSGCNYYTSLWSGTLKTGSTSAFTMDTSAYNKIAFVGILSSSGAVISTLVPVGWVTNGSQQIISDDGYYFRFSVALSGTSCTLTVQARNNTDYTCLRQVYGVI